MAELKDLESKASPDTETPDSEEKTPAAPTASTPSTGTDADDDNEFETPHLNEVKELFRKIVVTEKNLNLYPSFSKVVKGANIRIR